VNVYLYHYGIPLELIPVNAALEPPALRYQIGSNINEAEDMVGRDQVLPELHEGDVLAMYCAGAYGAAMQSNHCLRGAAPELLI
jgi:diaminopimelate decarboxylase